MSVRLLVCSDVCWSVTSSVPKTDVLLKTNPFRIYTGDVDTRAGRPGSALLGGGGAWALPGHKPEEDGVSSR